MVVFDPTPRGERVLGLLTRPTCMVGREMKRPTPSPRRQSRLLDGWRFLIGCRLPPSPYYSLARTRFSCLTKSSLLRSWLHGVIEWRQLLYRVYSIDIQSERTPCSLYPPRPVTNSSPSTTLTVGNVMNVGSESSWESKIREKRHPCCVLAF